MITKENALSQTEWTNSITSPPKLLYIDNTKPGNHCWIMHKHEKILEIVLVRSGHGIYCVEDHRYNIKAGDIIICNANTMHDEIPFEDEPYTTSCIGITDFYKEGFSENCIIRPDSNAIFKNPKQYPELVVLFSMLSAHFSETDFLSQYMCQGLLFAVLSLVTQMIDEDSCQLDDKPNLLSQIKQYIDIHYSENLTLEELSETFFISPTHLSHIFSRKYGYSLKQYIMRRRIGEAQNLLMYTQTRITDIAICLGFGDQSHFNKIFTKYTGITPTEFRAFRNNFIRLHEITK